MLTQASKFVPTLLYNQQLLEAEPEWLWTLLGIKYHLEGVLECNLALMLSWNLYDPYQQQSWSIEFILKKVIIGYTYFKQFFCIWSLCIWFLRMWSLHMWSLCMCWSPVWAFAGGRYCHHQSLHLVYQRLVILLQLLHFCFVCRKIMLALRSIKFYLRSLFDDVIICCCKGRKWLVGFSYEGYVIVGLVAV